MKKGNALEKTVFLLSLVFLSGLLGFALASLQWFPYPQLKRMSVDVRQLYREFQGRLPFYYKDEFRAPESLRHVAGSVDPQALTLVTRVIEDKRVEAAVINTRREVVHRWDLDIFRHWPEPENAPVDTWPRALPGALIHGALVLENGDLVFNYERFGLMRVDVCSEPVWKLPGYITHHSVDANDDGDLWVSASRIHAAAPEWMASHKPPVREEYALKVSPAGELLEAISIPRLLLDNGYRGLLYQSTLDRVPTVVGDSMHLNDVEEFSADLEAGYFGPGDVVVSLRNISTVFVFNVATRKIKYINTGAVLRQHDPDFFDGDRLSLFDNNTVRGGPSGESSRIVLLSAVDDSVEVVFPTPGEEFFTAAQGKHQWLDNGHLLITESQTGRAIEVDAQGEVVWEFVNYLEGDLVGLLLEATRLPAGFSSDSFAEMAKGCR